MNMNEVFDNDSEYQFDPSYSYTLSDVEDKLFELRNNGFKKGSWTGFNSLYKHYSCKKGSYSIIYAAPHMGKSQFTFEIAMNLAEFSGKKVAVMSPETGSVRDVYAELLWMYLRKPFIKNDVSYASDEEIAKGLKFVSDHFFVIDSGLDDMSVKGFFRQVDKIQQEQDVKIDVCMLDPYTEFVSEGEGEFRDDQRVGHDLNTIRKMSSAFDLHSILTMHVAKPQLRVVEGYKLPMIPDPTEIAGGQNSFRKGFMMASVHRMDKINPDTGEYFDGHAKGKLLFTVSKAKPKAVGQLGTIEMYYDKLANRYFVWDEEKKSRQYAHQNPEPETSEDFKPEKEIVQEAIF